MHIEAAAEGQPVQISKWLEHPHKWSTRMLNACFPQRSLLKIQKSLQMM